jgi:hypothetical protein
MSRALLCVRRPRWSQVCIFRVESVACLAGTLRSLSISSQGRQTTKGDVSLSSAGRRYHWCLALVSLLPGDENRAGGITRCRDDNGYGLQAYPLANWWSCC